MNPSIASYRWTSSHYIFMNYVTSLLLHSSCLFRPIIFCSHRSIPSNFDPKIYSNVKCHDVFLNNQINHVLHKFWIRYPTNDAPDIEPKKNCTKIDLWNNTPTTWSNCRFHVEYRHWRGYNRRKCQWLRLERNPMNSNGLESSLFERHKTQLHFKGSLLSYYVALIIMRIVRLPSRGVRSLLVRWLVSKLGRFFHRAVSCQIVGKNVRGAVDEKASKFQPLNSILCVGYLRVWSSCWCCWWKRGRETLTFDCVTQTPSDSNCNSLDVAVASS